MEHILFKGSKTIKIINKKYYIHKMKESHGHKAEPSRAIKQHAWYTHLPTLELGKAGLRYLGMRAWA